MPADGMLGSVLKAMPVEWRDARVRIALSKADLARGDCFPVPYRPEREVEGIAGSWDEKVSECNKLHRLQTPNACHIGLILDALDVEHQAKKKLKPKPIGWVPWKDLFSDGPTGKSGKPTTFCFTYQTGRNYRQANGHREKLGQDPDPKQAEEKVKQFNLLPLDYAYQQAGVKPLPKPKNGPRTNRSFLKYSNAAQAILAGRNARRQSFALTARPSLCAEINQI